MDRATFWKNLVSGKYFSGHVPIFGLGGRVCFDDDQPEMKQSFAAEEKVKSEIEKIASENELINMHGKGITLHLKDRKERTKCAVVFHPERKDTA